MLTLNKKILIDRCVGWPLVQSLNLLARPLGHLLRRDHRFGDTVKTIVVCKFLGLGSLVQSTPLLTALKIRYPEARIIYLTTRSNQGICEAIPSINGFLLIDDRDPLILMKTLAQAILACWRARVDLFFDLEVYSNLSSLLCILSLARNRLGYYTNPHNIMMIGIYTHMAYYNTFAPRHRIFAQLALLAGVTEKMIDDRLPPLTLRDEDWISACAKIPGLETRQYILVCPNASDLSAERRWPPDYFAAFCQRMAMQYPEMKIILCGSARERGQVENIIARTADSPRLVNSAGLFTLSELISVVMNARLMVSNDTGPMHIGLALQIPVLALFGPTAPRQCFLRRQDNFFPIYKNVYCSPCVHVFDTPPCGGNNICMKLIEVDEVFNAANLILKGLSPRIEPPLDHFLYQNGGITLGGAPKRQ